MGIVLYCDLCADICNAVISDIFFLVNCLFGFLTFFIILYNTEAKSIYRKTIIKYPQDTEFWATDFFVKGCKNFLDRCPKAYKLQPICARSYDGNFLDFNNYCEMQYENCNTWKNWYVYKRERC